LPPACGVPSGLAALRLPLIFAVAVEAVFLVFAGFLLAALFALFAFFSAVTHGFSGMVDWRWILFAGAAGAGLSDSHISSRYRGTDFRDGLDQRQVQSGLEENGKKRGG
jgi:hypothetical protein